MRYWLIAFFAFIGSAHALPGDGSLKDTSTRPIKVYCCQDRDGDYDYQRWHYKRFRHSDDDDRRYRRRERRSEERRSEWRRRSEGFEERGWWRPKDGWREIEDRENPHRCRAPMHSAGEADVRTSAARNKAIKAWQEQVINEYGERFLNFDSAYVIEEHCDPARVGEGNIIELKRCVLTAAPCLTPKAKLLRSDSDEGKEEHR